LFVHAAAHYEIHPNKSKNDRISDLFIGVLFGIPVKKYRKIHWLHHENLGKKDDPEHSYFNELNLLFLVKTITGLHTLSIILSRNKTVTRTDPKKNFLTHALYTFFFHAVTLFVLFIAGGWLLLLTWLAGLVIVFPVLATLRQLLEHRDTLAQKKVDYTETDHGKISRLFGEGIFDSSFGAACFNKHLLHHWDPTISYTRLQEVEDFLKNCPETAAIIKKSKTSYLKTFIALFKL
jgi:fatty acid desaturase